MVFIDQFWTRFISGSHAPVRHWVLGNIDGISVLSGVDQSITAVNVAPFKGQKISKANCDVLNSSKKTNKSDSAIKMGNKMSQKNKDTIMLNGL